MPGGPQASCLQRCPGTWTPLSRGCTFWGAGTPLLPHTWMGKPRGRQPPLSQHLPSSGRSQGRRDCRRAGSAFPPGLTFEGWLTSEPTSEMR